MAFSSKDEVVNHEIDIAEPYHARLERNCGRPADRLLVGLVSRLNVKTWDSQALLTKCALLLLDSTICRFSKEIVRMYLIHLRLRLFFLASFPILSMPLR